MARCPWYNNGLCYSEKTINEYGSPHPEPTRAGYCMSDNYRSCPYYVETGEHGVEEFVETLGVAVKEMYYPPIHVIPCSLKSECPFYTLKPFEKSHGLCVAMCRVTNTYIIKSKVSKCIDYWRDCPFYRIGVREF